MIAGDRDAAFEHVWETCDSHQWVIYYAQNDMILDHCSNDDAWEDLDLELEGAWSDIKMRVAFCAFREDCDAALSDLIGELPECISCDSFIVGEVFEDVDGDPVCEDCKEETSDE